LDIWAELKQGGLGLFAGMPVIRSAEGGLELSLRFRGRRDDPQVTGRLRVMDGKVTPAWLLPPMERLDLFAQIEDGQVILQQAQARVAPARWSCRAQAPCLCRGALGAPTSTSSPAPASMGAGGRLSCVSWRPPCIPSCAWRARGPAQLGQHPHRQRQPRSRVNWFARFTPQTRRKGFFDRLRGPARHRPEDVLRAPMPPGLHRYRRRVRLSGGGDERMLEGRLAHPGQRRHLLANFSWPTTRDPGRFHGAEPRELWGTRRAQRAVERRAQALMWR
jgi:hypothetical protein